VSKQGRIRAPGLSPCVGEAVGCRARRADEAGCWRRESEPLSPCGTDDCSATSFCLRLHRVRRIVGAAQQQEDSGGRRLPKSSCCQATPTIARRRQVHWPRLTPGESSVPHRAPRALQPTAYSLKPPHYLPRNLTEFTFGSHDSGSRVP
jgi:hypothetical protein